MRVEEANGRLNALRLRFYHSMYQMFIFTMLLVLLTNNLGILWVALEAATLTTVLLVSLYRSAASLEAAWKYFILCGVGIAQALFGTILVFSASEKILGSGGGTLLWTKLADVAPNLEPTVMSLAFVFLLVAAGWVLLLAMAAPLVSENYLRPKMAIARAAAHAAGQQNASLNQAFALLHGESAVLYLLASAALAWLVVRRAR